MGNKLTITVLEPYYTEKDGFVNCRSGTDAVLAYNRYRAQEPETQQQDIMNKWLRGGMFGFYIRIP